MFGKIKGKEIVPKIDVSVDVRSIKMINKVYKGKHTEVSNICTNVMATVYVNGAEISYREYEFNYISLEEIESKIKSIYE
jgi:hypothetical protein